MTRAQEFAPGNPVKGGTIYLTAADESGMMVSFIQSNYMGFGSGVVVPGYGLSLQNRGHGFSLDPTATGGWNDPTLVGENPIRFGVADIESTAIPEPSTGWLIAGAIGVLGALKITKGCALEIPRRG